MNEMWPQNVQQRKAHQREIHMFGGEYRVVKELLLQSLGERFEEERGCSDTILLEAPMQQWRRRIESMWSKRKHRLLN